MWSVKTSYLPLRSVYRVTSSGCWADQKEKINISNRTHKFATGLGHKDFPFFQIAIGWDGWSGFIKLLTKNFGASRYYLFRSPFKLCWGRQFPDPSVWKRGQLCVACARKPIALAGAVPPSLLVSSRKTNGTKEVVWRATPVTKNLQLFKISSFDNIPTTRLMLDDL